jgi:hypothetical protein
MVLFDGSRQLATSMQTRHTNTVNALVCSPAHELVYSLSRDLTLRSWATTSDNELAPRAAIKTTHTLSPAALAACTDASILATGGRDYNVFTWDAASLSSTSATATPLWAAPVLSQNVVTCLAWLPGAPALLLQGSEDCTLRLWDTRVVSRAPAVAFPRAAHFPLSCAAAPGEPAGAAGLVVSAHNGFDGDGCATTLWDARRAAPIATVTSSSAAAAAGGSEGEWGDRVFQHADAHTQAVSACTFLPGPVSHGGGSGSRGGASELAEATTTARVLTSGRDGALSWALPLQQAREGTADTWRPDYNTAVLELDRFHGPGAIDAEFDAPNTRGSRRAHYGCASESPAIVSAVSAAWCANPDVGRGHGAGSGAGVGFAFVGDHSGRVFGYQYDEAGARMHVRQGARAGDGQD